MTEYIVARAGELGPGDRKIVTIHGLQIGLFRIGDQYYALRNTCPHQLGPVCEGRIGAAIIADETTEWEPILAHEGEVLSCPWHGLEYHIRTGQCLAFPRVRLRRYRVRADGDEIKVSL
jgi:nitrite reductase/ring-hydroxylating ferredoxin subunit